MLPPIYTITGFDASAHTAEETVGASHAVPKGIVTSVLYASVFGYLMRCAFVIAIPNMDQAAASGGNVFFGTMDAVLFAFYTPAHTTIVSVTVVFIFISYGLQITLGFLALTAVVWFGFERRRLKGPSVVGITTK